MPAENPYPWLPDWYWQIYAETIYRFWRYVSEIQATARQRGFDIVLVSTTPPQIGSAGTVIFRASCLVLNFTDQRLFDDRVILSFGENHIRFLQWWIGASACARLPAPTPEEVIQEQWKGRPGWKPNREAALVLAEGLGKLV